MIMDKLTTGQTVFVKVLFDTSVKCTVVEEKANEPDVYIAKAVEDTDLFKKGDLITSTRNSMNLVTNENRKRAFFDWIANA